MSTFDDVREWMAEGDRLLAQAYDYLHGSDSDPSQLALADHAFSRAAQAYLSGGVESQHGAQATMKAGAPIEDPAELVRRLDGRLRGEAEAAQQSGGRHALTHADGGRGRAERARAFAEDLRERFSYVAPELFTDRTDAGRDHDHVLSRSR
jgi:hypothetical protein